MHEKHKGTNGAAGAKATVMRRGFPHAISVVMRLVWLNQLWHLFIKLFRFILVWIVPELNFEMG